MKKIYLVIIAITVLSALGAGIWFWQKQEAVSKPLDSVEQDRGKDSLPASEPQKKLSQNKICNSKRSNDSADDFSLWQNKETEFYSIQFPPGWCWIELTNNPQAHVLTYRSEFDLTQFPDIGTAGGWSLAMKDDEEIIVIFNGAPTLQGTNRTGKQVKTIEESFDSMARWMSEDYEAQCAVKELSATHSVQVCSYQENEKNVRLYSVANKENTIFMSVYRSMDNLFDDRILDKIADGMMLK